MGLVKDFLSSTVSFVKEEILPIRYDLIKAGLLSPDNTAYDAKASLVDPWHYGSMAYGYKEKYSILDYQKCRQISYADPIVAAVIQTRLNQVAAFAHPQIDKYNVGFKIIMRDKEASGSDGSKKRAKELEQFIVSCGVPENFDDTPEIRRRDSFESFLRKIVRDTLTFDQLNFEVIPRNDGKPYAFQAVDAATIRIIPDKKEVAERYGGIDVGKDADYSGFNRMSLGSEKVFKEFQPKNPRYAQVINGIVRHVFDEWEMAFGVRNPRTDIWASGYGFSEIEMLITAITSHMNAETYNRKFFSNGSSIKGILAFEGSVPPDQLEAFRRQWYQQVTGVNNAWRTPIMALGKEGKMNWVSLHSTNREMEFGKWLEYCIKSICGVYQIDPIEIGFDITKQGAGQGGGSGGGLGYGNQAERLMFSQDRGLRPLLFHIKSLINDYIVWRIDPEFEFDFVGLNENDEKDEIENAEKKVKTFKTINEVRAEHDLEPLPNLEKMAENPGDLVLDSSLIQFITAQISAKQQQEQQEQQMAQGMGPDGMPMDGQGGPGQEQGEMPPDGPVPEPEEEPDYANMSVDELKQEMDKEQGKLQPKEKPEGKPKPKVKKSLPRFFKEIDL